MARGSHLVAIRRSGLRIRSVRGDQHLQNVNVTDQPGEIGPVEVVLLAVKLWDIKAALALVEPLLQPDTVVITLQNGVDAPYQVAKVTGPGHVAAGCCFVNAGIAEPGVIVQRSKAQKLIAGMLNGDDSPILNRFGVACGDSGIEFQFAPAPLEALWEKFVQLVPISAMTAFLRCSIGRVRDDEVSWEFFLRILEETVLVGRATGARIPSQVVAERLAYVRNMPYDSIASMATDLGQRRRLELPWLSGRVSELGRHYGIPTPSNDFILAALEPFANGEGYGTLTY